MAHKLKDILDKALELPPNIRAYIAAVLLDSLDLEEDSPVIDAWRGEIDEGKVRARGDYRPDSDADVAVFLDHISDPLGEQLALIDEGYPILLSTGINIQPWVFEEASLSSPDKHCASHLVETVRREGLPYRGHTGKAGFRPSEAYHTTGTR